MPPQPAAITIALLCVAVLAAFGPEHLARLGAGTQAAWQYVLAGAQTAVLWAAVYALTSSVSIRALCAWGLVEAVQQPVCRLALPMSHPPALQPGQTLCDAVTGLPVSSLSIVAALFVAALHQEQCRAG